MIHILMTTFPSFELKTGKNVKEDEEFCSKESCEI